MTIDTITASESQTTPAEAWEQIKSKRAQIEEFADLPGSAAASNAIWSDIDNLERMIQASDENSPSAIEARLWCALAHLLTDRDDEALVAKGDLAALNEREAALDWPERLIVSALRSIRSLAQ